MSDLQIPVLYVLSNGRSGSTLLDLLLNVHPNMWTLGEAQMLPWEVQERHVPCGCGAAIDGCEFWGPLLERFTLATAPGGIGHFRTAAGTGRVLRVGQLVDIAAGRHTAPATGTAAAYGDINARFLRAVWAAAEQRGGQPIEWLVDASKDPYRLDWLQRSRQFDLRVIHIIKDPRAFVYSMTRHGGAGSRQVARMAARWTIENSVMNGVCRAVLAPGTVLRVRYEDLASDPGGTLGRIGNWMGTEFPANSLQLFRSVENHAVVGNAMRWQSGGIQLDTKWKSKLPRVHAELVWSLSWPLAKSYGYQHDGQVR